MSVKGDVSSRRTSKPTRASVIRVGLADVGAAVAIAGTSAVCRRCDQRRTASHGRHRTPMPTTARITRISISSAAVGRVSAHEEQVGVLDAWFGELDTWRRVADLPGAAVAGEPGKVRAGV